MIKAAVTTGKGDLTSLASDAQLWSRQLQLPYIERSTGTLEALLRELELDVVLLATAKGPELYSREGRLFFHPGMGLLRVKNIIAGQGDRLIEVMSLKEGMSVLDCSFGLGADAAVISFVVGATGQVVALEASPLIAFVMQRGLNFYKNDLLKDALQRIELKNCESFSYLKQLPDNSFDVVYFDPMFDYKIDSSSNMKPLRTVAYHEHVHDDFVQQAKRVAKLKVVIKLVRNSKLLDKFGLMITEDGKYSKVKYAVIEVFK